MTSFSEVYIVEEIESMQTYTAKILKKNTIESETIEKAINISILVPHLIIFMHIKKHRL